MNCKNNIHTGEKYKMSQLILSFDYTIKWEDGTKGAKRQY